jgi:hypothetical protein
VYRNRKGQDHTLDYYGWHLYHEPLRRVDADSHTRPAWHLFSSPTFRTISIRLERFSRREKGRSNQYIHRQGSRIMTRSVGLVSGINIRWPPTLQYFLMGFLRGCASASMVLRVYCAHPSPRQIWGVRELLVGTQHGPYGIGTLSTMSGWYLLHNLIFLLRTRAYINH